MKLDTKPGNVTLEQGLLIFALVILTGGALYKAFTYEPAAKAVASRPAPPPALKDPKLYSDIESGLKETPEIKPREHKLFVPRLIGLDPETGDIGVVDWNVPMKDGITPIWKQKYNFDLGDPTVATSDPDEDGYTNKEEFDAGTDPNDKASAPAVINKLYVKSYTPVQLQIIFKGYNETEAGSNIYEYQINTPSLTKRSWRLKEGEVIKVDEFNKYIIGKFRKNIVERVNPKTGVTEQVDISELDVTDPRLNETITLKFNTPQNSDQSTVGFELHVPGESPNPSDVAIGQKFKVRDTEYQLRRVENGNAVVLNLTTQKEVVIPKAGAPEMPKPAPVPPAA